MERENYHETIHACTLSFLFSKEMFSILTLFGIFSYFFRTLYLCSIYYDAACYACMFSTLKPATYDEPIPLYVSIYSCTPMSKMLLFILVFLLVC